MKKVLSVLALLLTFNTFAEVNLSAAYKREYIFLTSQKKALQKQKKDLEAKFQKAMKNAQRDLDNKQEKIVSLNANNEVLNEKLFKIEQNKESNLENKELYQNTLKQVYSALGLSEEQAKDLSFAQLMDMALTKLEMGNSIRQEKRNFFLENGEQVAGDLLYIGKIASYGHYKSKYYLLAPAGNGNLKVWKELPEAAGYFKGEYGAVIPMFVYEALEKPVTKKESQSVMEFVAAGGTIAWVIVGMGFVAMILCVIRLVSLKFYAKETSFIEDHCHVSDLDDTYESLKKHEKQTSQKELFVRILENKESTKESINDIIDEGIIHEHKIIDRFGALILVFAAVAPLLGLLGTVTGMISTFDIITEYGTGDPKLLSQGISEALITTELGLVVAIPTLLFGNILSGWGKNIKMTLEKMTLKLVNNI